MFQNVMATSDEGKYSARGNSGSLSSMKDAIQVHEKKMEEGRIARNMLKKLDNDLNSKKSEKTDLETELKNLKSQISILEGKIGTNERDSDRLSNQIDKTKVEFDILKNEYEEVSSKMAESRSLYHQTIPEKDSQFPFPIRAEDLQEDMLGDSNVSCFALGDIHGWAPGFLAFLMQNKLAEVEINGERCNSDSELPRFFPHPKDWDEQEIPIEGPWLDGSPFTPPKGSGNLRGRIYSIKIEPTKKLLQRSFLLQVGDLTDRGDHSELSIEIARQLVVKSGGRVIVLMGNHEGFLLEEDRPSWWKNEEKKRFDKKKPDFPGCHRYPSSEMGWPDKSTKSMVDSVFDSYSAHLSHLLLSQEFVLRRIMDESSAIRLKSLTQPSLELAGIDDAELSDIATGGGWNKVERSFEWLQSVWGSKDPMTLPGSPCLFSMGHLLGLHSESVALIEMTQGHWDSFKHHYLTKKGAQIRLLLYKTRGKSGKKMGPRGLTSSLLWSRDPGTRWGIGEVSSKLSKTAGIVSSNLPEITQIYHGHTPQQNIISLDVSAGPYTIRATNLDWSFTPPYMAEGRHGGDPYSTDRTVQFDTIATVTRQPKSYRPLALHQSCRAELAFEGSKSKARVVLKSPIRTRRKDIEICSFCFSDEGGISVVPTSAIKDIFFAKFDDGKINSFSETDGQDIDIYGKESLLIVQLEKRKAGLMSGSEYTGNWQKICFFQNESTSPPNPPLNEIEKKLEEYISSIMSRKTANPDPSPKVIHQTKKTAEEGGIISRDAPSPSKDIPRMPVGDAKRIISDSIADKSEKSGESEKLDDSERQDFDSFEDDDGVGEKDSPIDKGANEDE